MPVTNPWLSDPTPRRRLDRHELEERILNLFSSHNVGVLATTGPHGAHATPVRYNHLDLSVLFTAKAGSPKLRNIAADHRVSFAIVASLSGRASSRGAQIFGQARVLTPADNDHAYYFAAVRWENEQAERGLPVTEPPLGPLVVIDPARIVYTEHWLARSGYAPRQFWTRSASNNATVE